MKKSLLLLFSVGCCAIGSFLGSTPVKAQEITTDGTTNTTVNSDSNGNFTIEQGNRAGSNLFHSFGDFSVPTDGSAFFNNATDISNIFNRVTGGNISNIDGLIGANGSANLFLINPAGILFGDNARLDIGGSFFGTTADSILFEDGQFSATDLDNPPLLTINAPIGLNFRDNPNTITNSSFVLNEAGNDFVGLEVNTGENISLVGGDVTFNGGEATAPGGRIEIGGLRESGTVTIELDGSLTFPEAVAKANVFFGNASDVNVVSEGGGSISVNANNIELTGGDFGSSQLAAGILSSSTSADNQAGDIVLNATGTIDISQRSNIFNQVVAGGVGNAGNITLNTTNLTLLDGSQISAGIFGIGNAGTVTINASGDTTFQGIDSSGFSSGILSNIAFGGDGNAGDIQVNTGNLNLIDGGSITSDVLGTGNAGSIIINANQTTNISGSTVVDENFTRISQVSSSTSTDVVGNAGSIEINSDSLTLAEGSFISSSTFGRGNAGNVIVNAEGIVNLSNSSNIFSQIGATGEGSGGEIAIATSELSLIEGSQITAAVFGTGDAGSVIINASGDVTFQGISSIDGLASGIDNSVQAGGVGNAGSITINSDSLTLADGGSISSSTSGQGNAGNVIVNAAGIVNLLNSSNIFSQVGTTGEGNAGEITIATNSITFDNQSSLNSSTSGQGNAGNVIVNAAGIVNLSNSSNIFSQIGATGEGSGGEITIATSELSLTGGSQITAGVFGTGDAGSVIINASGDTTFQGISSTDGLASGIINSVEADGVGNAGDIQLNTANLDVIDGAIITTDVFGRGNAGDIIIEANVVNISGSSIFGESLTRTSRVSSSTDFDVIGNAGSIEIIANSLNLADGSFLSSGIAGEGITGNITIDVTEAVSLSNDSNIFNQVSSTGVGNSGSIILNTTDLFLLDGSQITAGVFGTGNAGSVDINASGDTTFQGIGNTGLPSGIVNDVAFGGSGNAGNIQLNTVNLNLIDGGSVSSDVLGTGNAGNITINAENAVNIAGFNIFNESIPRISQVSSQIGTDVEGNAGNIRIDANSLTISDSGFLSNSTFGRGNAGNVTINVENAVNVTNDARILSTVEPPAVGNSGGINITTTDLVLTEGSVLTASTFGEGNAGAITINATGNISVEGENSAGFSSAIFSAVNESAVGNSGGIDLTTANLTLIGGGQVVANTFGEGNAGNITIDATGNIFAEGENSAGFSSGIFNSVETTAVGNSGAIDITTNNLTLTQGSAISGSTSGEGNAGLITINAAGDISAEGENSGGLVSGVFSSVSIGSIGKAGGIDLTTTNLRLTGGGQITASTFSQGNAGAINISATGDVSAEGENSRGSTGSGVFSTVESLATGSSGEINITTNDLTLSGGGVVNGSTSGEGNAGLITINAAGDISVEGENSGGFVSGVFSRVNETAVGSSGGIDLSATDITLTQGAVINASTFGEGNAGAIAIDTSGDISAEGANSAGFVSGIFSVVGASGVGDAAGINIDADNVSLTDSGGISVSSAGTGNAANLAIDSNSLVLSDGAFVTASTPIGTGGSINLQIADRITLRDNSSISAQAFDNANGGNLTIDTDFIIAFPSQTGNGSDIVANAAGGNGGNINIIAESLLGIEERTATVGNRTNDIDASSEFGLDGTISIFTPDINPVQGVTELPDNVVEPEQTITQACANNQGIEVANSFVIKGKGGIPVLPTAPLSSEIVVGGESATSTIDSTTIATENGNITLAKGVIETADGQIILTPTPVTNSATRMFNGSPNCG